MIMWNKTIHTILVTLVFIVLLFIVSLAFQAIGQFFLKHDPYKVPRGHAVKVFQQQNTVPNQSRMLDKLITFYLYGEN